MGEKKAVIKNKLIVGPVLMIITALLVLGVIPKYMENKKLDLALKEIKATHDVQKKLKPLYDLMNSKIKDTAQLNVLNAPKSGALNRSQVSSISKIFKTMIEENGLECIQSRPDASTLNEEPKTMQVQLILKGELGKFRNFLFDMMNLDYLDSLEEVSFVSEQTGKKYMLKAWILVK